MNISPSLDHAAYYQIAQDIAVGMNYLHRHRPAVLHLDLKSMNVLLTSHLRAKIADFGFSKLRYGYRYQVNKHAKLGYWYSFWCDPSANMIPYNRFQLCVLSSRMGIKELRVWYGYIFSKHPAILGCI